MTTRTIFRSLGTILRQKGCPEKAFPVDRQIRSVSSSAYTARYEYETLQVTSPSENILHIELNRLNARNAMNKEMFREMYELFCRINDDKHCRAVVISGTGSQFSVGLDYNDMAEVVAQITGTSPHLPEGTSDVARKAKYIRSMIQLFQDSFTVIEKCTKPVISAVHGPCVGSALNLVAASDIRYASEDAYFQVKEIETGRAPDMGTLQRLPKLTGNQSYVKEMIYTACKLPAKEAKEMGLVSKIFASGEKAKEAAIKTAEVIASKSPVAIQGCKTCIRLSSDRSIDDGLTLMANWNMAMMQSDDLVQATSNLSEKKRKPASFSDL